MKIPGPLPSGFKIRPIYHLSARDRDLDVLRRDKAALVKQEKHLLAVVARNPAARCGAATKKTGQDLRAMLKEIGTHPEDDDAVLRNDRQKLVMAGKAFLLSLERDRTAGRSLLRYSASTKKAIEALAEVIKRIIQR